MPCRICSIIAALQGQATAVIWTGVGPDGIVFILPARVLYKLVKIHAALLACSVDTHEDLGPPGTVLRPVPVEDLSGLCECPWRPLTYVVMIIDIVDNKGE